MRVGVEARDGAGREGRSEARRGALKASPCDKGGGDDVLVVGAGLAGAVHARVLAEHGYRVTVIDRRPHIAGNCYDEVDANGVRVHRYGPHLFHTDNRAVFDWLSRFTAWVPYEHRVLARLADGRLAPLPVNMDTVNVVFGKDFRTAGETQAFLAAIAERPGTIRTAQDHLHAVIGRELTELFFRPYTRAMWQMDLSDMAPAVVRRLKVRMDRDPRYFGGEAHQALPAHGYTAMFEAIFDHDNITVELGRAFVPADAADVAHTFNAMPIDEFFAFRFGELPYRSIRFHTEAVPTAGAPPHPVINYTHGGPFTRETWWHNLPAHHVAPGPLVPRTVEEPCDYRDNAMERYYPVKSSDGRHEALYRRYKALAEAEAAAMTFIGRCGTYQYLDMHQVVNQSLMGVERWLALQPCRAAPASPGPASAGPASAGPASAGPASAGAASAGEPMRTARLA